MPESLAITCPQHAVVLLPSPDDPACLYCPDPGCGTLVRLQFPDGGFPAMPLTPLGAGASGHNELVLTYERAGFSRTEAMQVLCTLITALIMKGSGSSD